MHPPASEAGETSATKPSLLIIRGNSASGKTRAAKTIRERYGRGVAIVSQDVLRRDVLQQRDTPGNPAIGLIDLTARYALEQGFHVIVEGILYAHIYSEMLTRLVSDHAGPVACYYYDLSFEETASRHASKPESAEYGTDMMADWYRERDVIPALNETILDASVSLNGAVSLMMNAVVLQPNSGKDSQ